MSYPYPKDAGQSSNLWWTTKFVIDMVNTSANNKRIAKNTLLLYFRMLFMMVVSLYTSRVVLNTLGVEDYGIYNVVGGVVTMFSFISGAMASGTQRFLTYELGKGNVERLSKVFSTSLIIHILISVLITLLAETIGLWFLTHKMAIPDNRMNAAFWVYQFSILSTIVMIMSVPYNASIIAHERMSAFAYVSILEVVLKLLVVYLLLIGDFDKLKLYALLIFIVQLGIRFIYGAYCKRHFEEARFKKVWDKKLFQEMLGFSGWNLWGNCAVIAFTQGLNILLNIFFGPAINAARGIAVQVQGAVTQFSTNFQTALNPQIIKSYASNDLAYMHSLIYKSSKFTFFLLLLLSLPIILETDTILRIWLHTVPDQTVHFLRLILCISIVDAMANPFVTSVSATGKIKLYQGIIGGTLLCILPVSYIVLKYDGKPISVFIVHLCICLIAFIIRLYIVRPLINLKVSDYIQQVIYRCLSVGIISIVLPAIMKYNLPDNIYSFFIICSSCIISVSICVFYIGLDVSERRFMKDRLLKVLKIRKN